MMKKRRDDHAELRDPELSALLQDAFADDPALAPAPGRTERIMRTVLAHPRRKPWFTINWAPMGWMTGAMATAAVAVMLLLHLPFAVPDAAEIGPVAVAPTVKPKPVWPPLAARVPETPTVAARPPKAVTPIPDPRWTVADVASGPREKPETPWIKPEKNQATDTAPPAEMDNAGTAAALYAAGTEAYATGDYEHAYQSYQASYDTMPTPEAILGSGQVLQQMAQETLTTKG